MPATVQAMLAARIDRLAAEDKRLLQTAAVIGKDVPYALLESIADLNEADLRQRLSQLQEAEYLYEARLFPDLEYTFKHALTHDVAYASLLQERKHELHVRIVETIERLYRDRLDEQIELLAHHALRAEMWERALLYLRRAADKASSRWAFREAARYLELALNAVGHLPERGDLFGEEIDIRLDLRTALTPAAQFNRIAEVIAGAITLAERIGDRTRLAWAFAYHAFISIERCEQQQALESGQRAMALAEEIEEPALTASARYFLMQVHHTLANYQEAIEVGRPALEISDDVVVKSVAKGLYSAIPHYLLFSLAEVGSFADATTHGDLMLRRAEAAGNPFAIVLVCVGYGYAHARCGSADKAIPLLERALQLCRTYAIDIQVPWTASSLGFAYALAGSHEAGVEHAEHAVERADSLGITRYQPLRVTLLSNAYLLAGRCEDAHAAAQRALELARRYQEKGPEAWALYLIAASVTQFEPHQRKEVLDNYLAALNLADELGMRPLIAHCHFGLGELHQRMGNSSEARAELSQATEMYRQMDMQFYLRQAEEVLKAIH
jgi:tetratricopeptide (TPR) repeat protein